MQQNGEVDAKTGRRQVGRMVSLVQYGSAQCAPVHERVQPQANNHANPAQAGRTPRLVLMSVMMTVLGC